MAISMYYRSGFSIGLLSRSRFMVNGVLIVFLSSYSQLNSSKKAMFFNFEKSSISLTLSSFDSNVSISMIPGLS